VTTHPHLVDATVIGAGQAGLSAAYFLRRAGFAPDTGYVVLDADHGPGGAWQHRWPSLHFDRAHGFHPLPGMDLPDIDPTAPASAIVSDYFAEYEHRFALPVHRPVRVTSVRETDDDRLLVHSDAGDWATRVLLNATGTWTRPFWPSYPGRRTFRGRQLHTADYVAAEEFAGRHVIVVGGGHSAVQLLAEISEVTTTTWVTRRPPQWRQGPFDHDAGRRAVAMVEAAVRAGRRPPSVVSVTGLVHTPATLAARDRGALHRLPMFDRITPHGVAWDDGRFIAADVILWCTGFRWALDHLAPLHLRAPGGGITMDGTQVARDPRIHLLGYGPSAHTIGANRAGRTAVRDILKALDRTAASATAGAAAA
jgi:cation diffusion facilitator CzcD-associated flavoprotein CzcO